MEYDVCKDPPYTQFHTVFQYSQILYQRKLRQERKYCYILAVSTASVLHLGLRELRTFKKNNKKSLRLHFCFVRLDE